MININYQRLFNLKVSHNYYKDGLARGIHLTPTKETTNLLKNGRMLLKKVQQQTVVLYRGLNETPPVVPPNPFIALEADFRFTFALTVESKSEFINKTNLDESALNTYQSSNILYFINNPAAASDDATAPEDLNYSLLDSIRNSLFTYDFQLIPVPPAPSEVQLTVFSINDDGTLGAAVDIGKDSDGVPITTPLIVEVDAASQGFYSLSIDLRNKKKGRYKIQVEDANNLGPILREETIYVDNELATQDVLGIVDIIYEPSAVASPAYGATEEYNIQFVSKQTFWKYIIVDKTTAAITDTFTITDLGTLAPAIPYQFNLISLPVGDPDTLINGNPAKVFRSNSAIEFSETPKTKIELEITPGNIKIENLPNASPNAIVKKNENTSELESEIYVFL